MSFINKILGSVLAIMIVVGGAYMIARNAIGNESEGYMATTTTSTSVSGATAYQARSTFGILHTVTVSSSTPQLQYAGNALLGVYDGLYSTSTATSTIAKFPAPTAAGTYIYDVAFTKGLLIDVPPGFNGVYTFTFK